MEPISFAIRVFAHLHVLVVGEGLLELAVVLDNDHLLVVIGGLAKDGVYAALEKVHVVS